jgi:alpha-N-acetylglucosamine transferase
MIPGGRASFWGMSFNKLRIFRMTEFKKIMFIDADVAIFQNIDWIMHEPDFTAAFTTECCNGGARGKLGGGMWVFEVASRERAIELIESDPYYKARPRAFRLLAWGQALR